MPTLQFSATANKLTLQNFPCIAAGSIGFWDAKFSLSPALATLHPSVFFQYRQEPPKEYKLASDGTIPAMQLDLQRAGLYTVWIPNPFDESEPPNYAAFLSVEPSGNNFDTEQKHLPGDAPILPYERSQDE